MPDPTLYLFDGHNLMYAAGLRERQALVDRLAGFVALRGARGVVVFDGLGEEVSVGPLDVRFATPADHLLERLAAEGRRSHLVCLVSSDQAVRGTSGQEVMHLSSASFLRELSAEALPETPRGASWSRIGEALDEETRARLDRLRRGGH